MPKSNNSLYENKIKVTSKGKDILNSLGTESRTDETTKNSPTITDPAYQSHLRTLFPFLMKMAKQSSSETFAQMSLPSKKAKKSYYIWKKNHENVKVFINKEIQRK